MSPRQGSVQKILVIAATNVRRLFRDRVNIFFILLFPLLLIFVLGTVFGGGMDAGLGVVAPEGDRLAEELVSTLAAADEIDLHRYDGEDELRSAVERASVRAGVVVPDGYGRTLRRGERAEVRFVNRPDGLGAELRSVIEAAVGDQSVTVQAAQFAVAESGADFEAVLAEASERRSDLAEVEVRTTTVGEERFPEEFGQYGQGASSQLVLFMFVTGLATSSALILSRQLGVSRRMLSTPTTTTVVLLGEALGRFVVVAFQGLYILLATWLVFGVDWGDPVGAVALLLAFAAVATGTAMLAGALFRNDQQASGVGLVIGLGLAALGGCMVPLEQFSPTMRTVAHATPHAWALDGFSGLIRDHGSVLDILPELGILAAMAAVVLTLGTRQLHRAITSG